MGTDQGVSHVSKPEHWMHEPEAHDYPAANSYLSLVMGPGRAGRVVADLQQASIAHWKAKDLLRASGLALLGPDNHHVARDLQKVKDRKRLSPVLLVRGSLEDGLPLTVADGYHRICASYHLDEDADIPCRMAELTSDRPE